MCNEHAHFLREYLCGSLTVSVSEWLEGHAGKHGSLVRFPADAYIFILIFSFTFRSSQLGEAYTNEIKHDIHPEYWV